MNRECPDDAAVRWQTALGQSLRSPTQPLVDRIVVLEETASTQDECRRLAQDRPGCLVTALRQTSGRGRLGRRWADDRGRGVALTVSVAAQSPERLSIAAAVAVCESLEPFAGRGLGLRWPNDIMGEGCKLAGILIEQHDPIALVGIGVNVNQTYWPADFDGLAVSLRQLRGAEVDRIAVTIAIVERLASTLSHSDAELAAAFARRDTLAGTTRTFTLGRETITGMVERVDPLKGIVVRTEAASRTLPAAATSLVHSRR